MPTLVERFRALSQKPDALRSVHRTAPHAGLSHGDGLRVAVERVDLSGRPGAPTSGQGFTQPDYTQGWLGGVSATLIGLDDGRGGRVALITSDLHAGSRYLAERISRHEQWGLGRVLLMGTHTHAAQNPCYGDRFYDQTASPKGIDTEWIDAATLQLRSALSRLATRLEDADSKGGLSYGEVAAPGYVWHRSLDAWIRNLKPRWWIRTLRTPERPELEHHVRTAFAALHPGVDEPPDFDDDDDHGEIYSRLGRLAADSRLRALVATDDRGRIQGAMVFVSATPSMLGARRFLLSGDVATLAAHHAMRVLGKRHGRTIPVAWAPGAMGDANVSDPELSVPRNIERMVRPADAWGEGTHTAHRFAHAAWVRDVAERLGDHLVRAIDAATPLHDDTITTSLHEFAWPGAVVRGKGILGEAVCIGWAVANASEFNRAHQRPDAEREPQAMPTGADAHWPKKTFWLANLLEKPIRKTEPRDVAPVGTVVTVRLGELALCGVPTEPSARLGLRIEERVKAMDHDAPKKVIVAGLVHGFIGYANTAEEYLAQNYEGASQFPGRHFGDYVEERVLEALQRPGNHLVWGTEAPFTTPYPGGANAVPGRPFRARVHGAAGPGRTAPEGLEVDIVGAADRRRLKVHGWWSTKRPPEQIAARLRMNAGPLVTLWDVQRDRPLTAGGLRLDDRDGDLTVYYHRPATLRLPRFAIEGSVRLSLLDDLPDRVGFVVHWPVCWPSGAPGAGPGWTLVEGGLLFAP
ncbi:MAG: neutral/alkaline non-lysosomal ceramidase N-terminal domain-containing protein [Myxococcales bacterium]|nr:neutral/alkaline non-lysosomal ceramidase N-terminal domain-containing protein [Myxococcales bacterium]